MESNARGRFVSRAFVRGTFASDRPRLRDTSRPARAGEHRRRIAFHAPRAHRVAHRPAPSPPDHPRALSRGIASPNPRPRRQSEATPRDDTRSIMPAAGEKPVPEPDMYASLGVSKTATNTEIRRAYRNLITKVRGYPSKLTRRPGVSLADGRSFAFSPENARSPRRARLTASAHPDRSIPTRAATPSSLSELSAPTTSSPTRRSARTTTPPARLRDPWRRSSSRPSAGARSEIPAETARRWRRSPSRTPSSRRRNKR